MRISGRATLGVASLCATACSGSTEPPVSVSAVAPAAAYNDEKVSLVITGGPFRAAFDIDTSSGRAETQLGAFTAFLLPNALSAQRVAFDSLTWLSPSALKATLPIRVAAGAYDVEVRDPRGALGLLEQGFVSLGPEVMAPMVSIVEPTGGTVVNAAADVPVAFWADDGPGRVASMAWKVSSPDIQTISGTCTVGQNVPRASCRFTFMVPPPAQIGQALNVNVEAVNGGGKVARAATTVAVGIAAGVTRFSPIEGPAAGGTKVTVTGDNFIPGTKVLVDGLPLEPQGGTVVDGHTIEGTTTAHAPGLFPLSVQTGAVVVRAKSGFGFVGHPQVRLVTPSSGPVAGGTVITIVGKDFRERKTVFKIGTDATSAVELGCVLFVSSNRVQATTPRGTGEAAIFAHDPVGGDDLLPGAFTYVSNDSPDGPLPSGASCDGGMP